ncbi:MAG: hypothetical protein PHO56_00930 [Patescibacteria group bacterium]|nr:hypothetical protein [Patescibacteria group bacterium]
MKIIILKKIFFIAIILALVFGFAYTLAQQVMRQSAYDPQIQIAEDSAAVLAKGEQPDFLRANAYGTIDLNKSLAPFLITFDSIGQTLVSTAMLNGKIPVPPAGVFVYAKAHGLDKLTWQPAPNVRIAMVLAYYSGNGGGFALAGRSLREVENRAGSLEFLTFLAWAFSVIIAGIGILLIEHRTKNKEHI